MNKGSAIMRDKQHNIGVYLYFSTLSRYLFPRTGIDVFYIS